MLAEIFFLESCLISLTFSIGFNEDFFLQPYDAGQLNDPLNFACLHWTRWINADYPTGEGDWETVSAPGDKGRPGTINQQFPDLDICNTPVTVQCRSRVDNASWISVYDELSVPCSTQKGLVCLTRNQPYERQCRDYEIRFLCWKDCPQLEWSTWMDFDGPDGHGDVEMLGETIPKDRWPCSGGEIPVDSQCETLTGIRAFQSKKRGLQCSNLGLSCLNSLQGPDCNCNDFKVRFLCPVKQYFPSGYKHAPMFY